jgi:Ca-activated chloride channel homolog
MRNTRILTLVLAAILIVGAVAWRVAGGDGGGDDPASTEAPADAVRVPFAFSPEKEALLTPLIEAWNAEGREVGGRRVVVEGQVVSSGAGAERIPRGDLQPVVWSTASSLWGRVVNFRADRELTSDRAPSLVRTPLVIAMWEPMARALGWPEKPIGWSDVLREATSERGWAAYGRPEFGRFKLGHTNPDFSTSGLSAVVAEYLAATGKSEGLTVADVRSPRVRERVRAIERSIVHYGDTTLFFADQLAERGPSYASAVALEEVTVLDFNLNRAPNGRRLAAIYPKEGTFYSDNPLFVLDAPWVSPEQREAAEAFVAHLRERVTPEEAARLYFRPGDPAREPSAPITRENLVDPAQPTRILGLPEPRVLNAIQAAWRQDRKPARVQVVLDVSGSMQEEGKLLAAQQGLVRFLGLMQPQDEVGLTVFNDRVTPVVPPTPIRTGRQRLVQAVESTLAEGDTAVYDATQQAVGAVAREATPDRINAVVVLTDGQDNSSVTPLPEVLEDLRAQQGIESAGVRVFTIAYGSGANTAELERVAQAGGGRAYTGDPETIEAVYTQIASFF